MSVLADVKNINKNLGTVTDKLSGFERGAKRVGDTLKTALVAGGVVVAAKAIGGFFTDAVKSADEGVARTKVLAQVFESMGGAGSEAFKQAGDQATNLGKAIAVPATEVTNVQAKLATFGKIWDDPVKGAQNFERATTIAFDLAAAGFGSADGNAAQLGKALQDPIKGMSALAKSGVTFTDSEKAKITALQESGNLLGAQEILYGALENQVGGAAEANVTASQRMSVAFGELQEKIGTYLLPIVERFSIYFTETLLPALDSAATYFNDRIVPALTAFGEQVGSVAGPAVERLGNLLTGTLVPALQAAYNFYQENSTAINALAVAVGTVVAGLVAYNTYLAIVRGAMMAAAAVQAALNLVMAANPIGIVVLAIAALVAALIYLYNNNETVRAAIDKAWSAIKSAATAVWGFLSTFIPQAWNNIKTSAINAVGQIKAGVSTAWNAIKSVTSSVWNGIKSVTSSVWNAIKSVITAAVNTVKRSIEGWKVIIGIVRNAFNSAKAAVVSAINGIISTVSGVKGRITGALSNAGTLLRSAGRNIIEGLIGGIKAKVGAAVSAVKNAVGSVVSGAKAALGIRSPSRVFRTIGVFVNEGLVQGLEKLQKVRKATVGLANTVSGNFKPELSLSRPGTLTPATAGAASGNTYQITIQTLTVDDNTERVIHRAIQNYERKNGVRR